MMGEKLERIEKIGIKFLGREGKGGGVGEGGVPKQSKTHYSLDALTLYYIIYDKVIKSRELEIKGILFEPLLIKTQR